MKKLRILTALAMGLLSVSSFGRNLQSAFQQDPSLAEESEEIGLSVFQTWFELNFEKDSTYSYVLGLKFLENNGTTEKLTTSRLLKNGIVVDEHTHKNLFNYGFIKLDTLFRYVPFSGLNELAVLESGGAFCGAGQSKILIGRSGIKRCQRIW